MPLPLSILVPAYNHARYVAAALQSILTQDYPDLEIVVIDDGSTDGTAEIAQRVLEQSGRPYRLERQANAGAHAALNRGIQLAQGDTIAILNSDDRFLPGRLRIMVEALENAHRRFAFSRVAHIDAEGQPHPYQEAYLRQLAEARQFPTLNFEFLRHNIAATTGNFVFHRSLYDEVGGFAGYTTCHDWDYILRVMLLEEPLFVDEPLLEYRIHSQGTLQKQLARVDEEVGQIMIHYLEKVTQAKNPLAPGPAHWGGYWPYFCKNHLERIRALPPVQAQLDELAAELPRQGELAWLEGDSRQSPGGPAAATDLDLTQITLDIPAIAQEVKKQPRLLLVLPWMVMGGAERFTLNLMDQLSDRGWQASVVATSPASNAWYGQFCQRTADIFVLPELMPVRHYPRFLRSLIELRNFDAVLIQGSLEGYRLAPILRALFPRLPILDYLHFVTPDWMGGGFPRLSCLYRDAIDLSITSCEQVKRWMIQAGKEAERLRVCPIGVDAHAWAKDTGAGERLRQELGIGIDEVVLIYAARLEAQKSPLAFAETLRVLSEQGVAFRALVAGEGALHSELEQRLHQDGLSDRVSLLGALPAEEMPALLSAGDIFFLPSQNEGISSAIYEAMACGLPVVGADVGGQSELVTPDCGILVPVLPEAQQPGAYAQALKALIGDKARRQAMGASGRERILAGFTIEAMGAAMAGTLSEAILLKCDGQLPPITLSSEETLTREAQHVVEYLQARQAWRDLNQNHQDLIRTHEEVSRQYLDLLQPKPPSHWFYLWVRQLFLPVFERLKHSRLGVVAVALQLRLKRAWIKE